MNLLLDSRCRDTRFLLPTLGWRMPALLSILSLISLLGVVVQAQPTGDPTLVDDIAIGTDERAPFRGLVAAADSSLLFQANDQIRGSEVWITDGTVPGTRLWTEVCPGDCRYQLPSTGASINAVWDGQRAYFSADDGLHGYELWTADGSSDGTRLVRDICPGECDGPLGEIVQVADRVFFRARDLEHGFELWTSDGTRNGTVRLTDINPGPDNSYATSILPFDGGVAFQVYQPEFGTEWWRSDGTLAGTMRITDLCPGPCSAVTPNAVVFEDSIVFSTASQSDTEVLYRLRPSGDIESLATICDGTCSGFIAFLYPTNGSLYFAKDGRLWRTDGTATGTQSIVDLPPDTWFVRDVEVVAGGVLFSAEAAFGIDAAVYRLDGGQLSTLIERTASQIRAGADREWDVDVQHLRRFILDLANRRHGRWHGLDRPNRGSAHLLHPQPASST